jgi:hypothetical protein
MAKIRTREGAGGRQYEVVIQRPGQARVTRLFRRLNEAKMWAMQQERLREPERDPGSQ